VRYYFFIVTISNKIGQKECKKRMPHFYWVYLDSYTKLQKVRACESPAFIFFIKCLQ